MAASSRVRDQIERGSWIRRMFEEGARLRAEHGDRVVDLSLGNPEVEPPQAFQEALERAARDTHPGLHRYMPNAGLVATREAVARQLSMETGLSFQFSDVLMVCGAAAGLNVLLKAILEPGEEVVILAPYFPEYLFYIDNAGGVPRIAATRRDFSLDLDAIEAALGPRTRAIIVSSPNNPTGVTYSAAEIRGLADLLRRRAPHVYLISDEPYKRLVFEGTAYAQVLGVYERAIAVGSHSKDLAIPGERIGHVAFSPEIPASERAELIAASTFLNRTLGFVNAPALMQRVVADLQGVSVPPAFYQERRDLLCGGLERMGYRFVKPTGAFYLFLETPIPDDVRFLRELSQRLVLTVPGTGFGVPGHVRVSYCVGLDRIERALPAFAEVARAHGLVPPARS